MIFRKQNTLLEHIDGAKPGDRAEKQGITLTGASHKPVTNTGILPLIFYNVAGP